MVFAKDIENRITKFFPDSHRAQKILSNLQVSSERERLIRCILVLSDHDYDAMASWVKKANEDFRNIIAFAEYDNREIRVNNYNYPIDEQKPYSYE